MNDNICKYYGWELKRHVLHYKEICNSKPKNFYSSTSFSPPSCVVVHIPKSALLRFFLHKTYPLCLWKNPAKKYWN